MPADRALVRSRPTRREGALRHTWWLRCLADFGTVGRVQVVNVERSVAVELHHLSRRASRRRDASYRAGSGTRRRSCHDQARSSCHPCGARACPGENGQVFVFGAPVRRDLVAVRHLEAQREGPTLRRVSVQHHDFAPLGKSGGASPDRISAGLTNTGSATVTGLRCSTSVLRDGGGSAAFTEHAEPAIASTTTLKLIFIGIFPGAWWRGQCAKDGGGNIGRGLSGAIWRW